jgi:hypothetical protein
MRFRLSWAEMLPSEAIAGLKGTLEMCPGTATFADLCELFHQIVDEHEVGTDDAAEIAVRFGASVTDAGKSARLAATVDAIVERAVWKDGGEK